MIVSLTLLWRYYHIGEEKKGKVEETAEKTGDVIGKGVKKGWGVVKGLGKGMKDAEEEKK